MKAGCCEICGRAGATEMVTFEENISYFIRRTERKISGNLCWLCTRETFKTFELNTLAGTWWGAIGCWIGPHILICNLLQYRRARRAFQEKSGVTHRGREPSQTNLFHWRREHQVALLSAIALGAIIALILAIAMSDTFTRFRIGKVYCNYDCWYLLSGYWLRIIGWSAFGGLVGGTLVYIRQLLRT